MGTSLDGICAISLLNDADVAIPILRTLTSTIRNCARTLQLFGPGSEPKRQGSGFRGLGFRGLGV